eukprot:TRINITY_DN11146_c0_g1_i2.p1 TRINITY_DN11146_c0_g1~~TRINITY_DN11146_c0_g1_i2.p1  ORF type:complete len:122 (-),score=17.42 TRINITY_DN11146_c0_g1_i2:81-446(-)
MLWKAFWHYVHSRSLQPKPTTLLVGALSSVNKLCTCGAKAQNEEATAPQSDDDPSAAETSPPQSGQVLRHSANHFTMQPRWKRCLHGKEVTLSSLSKADRQTPHSQVWSTSASRETNNNCA